MSYPTIGMPGLGIDWSPATIEQMLRTEHLHIYPSVDGTEGFVCYEQERDAFVYDPAFDEQQRLQFGTFLDLVTCLAFPKQRGKSPATIEYELRRGVFIDTFEGSGAGRVEYRLRFDTERDVFIYAPTLPGEKWRTWTFATFLEMATWIALEGQDFL